MIPETKSRTGITSIAPGQILIKGYDIGDLMGHKNFAEVVFLILKGRLPDTVEAKLMNAILVSSVDHGVTPPSSLAARTIISGGNALNAAVAGGILTIGDSHGGAIEQCARILQERVSLPGDLHMKAVELINEFSGKKVRLPGFGHRLHKVDPRASRLFEMAKELDYMGKHQELAKEIELVFKQQGKELPINVDGAIAAVTSDMGFDWRLGKGFFIISRTAGLIAHAHEEMTREKPMRNFGLAEYEYDGPAPRKLIE